MLENAIEFLRCPRCHGVDWGVSSTLLTCRICGSDFSYASGTVWFSSTDSAGFSIRWKHNLAPQATNEWFKTFYERADLEGKVVLDAGCGIGRYSKDALDLGAATVLSVDLSDAAIAGTLMNAPGAIVIQADLLVLPVRTESVDCAFSIGVLHHTPDPRAAFMEVARTVKKGGLFSCWVYADSETDPTVKAAQELLHAITKACPPEELHKAIKEHAIQVRDIYDDRWEPLMRVLRVSVSKDDAECISDTVDWHAPRYRSCHTVAEVHSWYTDAGFKVLKQGIQRFNTAFLGEKL